MCAQRDEPPQLHDQWFYQSELRALAEYAPTERLSLELQVPFRITQTSIVYRQLDGTAFTPQDPDIHHRNELLAGLGDPWVSVRLQLEAAGVRFIPRLGVSIPLGRTEPNPFQLGAQGLTHQHVQFGTGTFDPVAGLEAWRPFGRVTLSGYLQGQWALVQNRHGYRAGNRYALGVASAVAVGAGWVLSGGADLLNEQPERWNGEVLQDGNLGRTDLLLGASVLYRWRKAAVSLGVKVPVYQHFIHPPGEDAQLTYPGVLNLTVQTSLGGP